MATPASENHLRQPGWTPISSNTCTSWQHSQRIVAARLVDSVRSSPRWQHPLDAFASCSSTRMKRLEASEDGAEAVAGAESIRRQRRPPVAGLEEVTARAQAPTAARTMMGKDSEKYKHAEAFVGSLMSNGASQDSKGLSHEAPAQHAPSRIEARPNSIERTEMACKSRDESWPDEAGNRSSRMGAKQAVSSMTKAIGLAAADNGKERPRPREESSVEVGEFVIPRTKERTRATARAASLVENPVTKAMAQPVRLTPAEENGKHRPRPRAESLADVGESAHLSEKQRTPPAAGTTSVAEKQTTKDMAQHVALAATEGNGKQRPRPRADRLAEAEESVDPRATPATVGTAPIEIPAEYTRAEISSDSFMPVPNGASQRSTGISQEEQTPAAAPAPTTTTFARPPNGARNYRGAARTSCARSDDAASLLVLPRSRFVPQPLAASTEGVDRYRAGLCQIVHAELGQLHAWQLAAPSPSQRNCKTTTIAAGTRQEIARSLREILLAALQRFTVAPVSAPTAPTCKLREELRCHQVSTSLLIRRQHMQRQLTRLERRCRVWRGLLNKLRLPPVPHEEDVS